MRRRLSLFAGLFAFAFACGCGVGGWNADVAVRDSAGVRIVENRRPVWPESLFWRVPDRLLVQIGAGAGGGEDDAQGGRFRGIADALRLSDGRIVVTDRGRRELRFYDGAGAFQTATGGEGLEPGRFQSPGMLGRLPGDSILVYDDGLQRISVYDPSGVLARVEVLRPESRRGGTRFVGRFADGGSVVYEGSGPAPVEYGATWAGVYRDTSVLVRLGPDGGPLDTLGRFPGQERFVLARPRRMSVRGLPFGKRRVEAVHGGMLLLGFTDRYEVRFHSVDGVLRSVARKRVQPRQVTAEDRERYGAELRSQPVAPGGPSADEILAALEFPERHPAFERFLVDGPGNLWVEEYRRPGAGRASRWSVFDPEHRWLGIVQVPSGLNVRDIGEDHVLGTATDVFGVRYVRLYPLIKPDPGDGG